MENQIQLVVYNEKCHCPSNRTALGLARTFCVTGQLKREMPGQNVASWPHTRKTPQSTFMDSTSTYQPRGRELTRSRCWMRIQEWVNEWMNRELLWARHQLNSRIFQLGKKVISYWPNKASTTCMNLRIVITSTCDCFFSKLRASQLLFSLT